MRLDKLLRLLPLLTAVSLLITVGSAAGVQSAHIETKEARQSIPVSLIYTIQPGDNLSRLAVEYSWTVEELASFNGISAAEPLRAGRRLAIPLKERVPGPVVYGPYGGPYEEWRLEGCQLVNGSFESGLYPKPWSNACYYVCDRGESAVHLQRSNGEWRYYRFCGSCADAAAICGADQPGEEFSGLPAGHAYGPYENRCSGVGCPPPRYVGCYSQGNLVFLGSYTYYFERCEGAEALAEW